MKRINFVLLVLMLLVLFIFISASSYARTVSQDLSNNFFRLHILANSDSELDQSLKLKVRDAVIDYMSNLNYDDLSKDEIIETTNNHLDDLKKVAEGALRENNCNYNINLEVGNFYFPTKEYGNITLPAGLYDGLKIELGNAKGQNWWCSLFPPLCFVDISSGIIDEDSKNDLKENLSEEEFAIITSDSNEIKLKFKILELFSN